MTVAFNRDGTKILAAYGSGIVGVYDLTGGDGVFVNHGEMVLSAAFSPDGAFVATGGRDKTVKIWDASDGGDVLHSLGHDHCVYDVVFSPDGTMLATASGNFYSRDPPSGDARVWAVSDGTLVDQLMHDGAVVDLAFSRDGDTIATASRDGNARLWRPQSKKDRVLTLPHRSAVKSVTFSPDGKSVATGSGADGKNGEVQFWNVLTGEKVGAPFPHPAVVAFVTLSSDGRTMLSTCGDGRARLWNLDDGKLRGKAMQSWFYGAALSPNGRFAATTTREGFGPGYLQLWDGHTALPIGEPVRLEWSFCKMAFSPDSRAIVIGNRPPGHNNLGEAMIWTVPSPAFHDATRPDRLRFSLEVRTCKELTASGEVSPLTFRQWQNRRQQLEKWDGPCDAPTFEQYETWQANQRL